MTASNKENAHVYRIRKDARRAMKRAWAQSEKGSEWSSFSLETFCLGQGVLEITWGEEEERDDAAACWVPDHVRNSAWQAIEMMKLEGVAEVIAPFGAILDVTDTARFFATIDAVTPRDARDLMSWRDRAQIIKIGAEASGFHVGFAADKVMADADTIIARSAKKVVDCEFAQRATASMARLATPEYRDEFWWRNQDFWG